MIAFHFYVIASHSIIASVCVPVCTHFEALHFHPSASYVSVAEALSCWTPCLPSAIPERFAGGLSCQGMTIRLTGCGLCQPASISSVYEFGYQACGHQFSIMGIRPAGISQYLRISYLRVSSSTIASNPAGIPQALWTRGRRLHRSEDLIDGQPVFHSLPPVTRRKQKKRSVSEQRSPEQWFPPSVDSRIEIPIETDLPVVQTNQNSMTAPTGVEEMMRQMQETMRAMQQDANAPPNTQNTVPTIQNLQEDTNLPTGPAPPPLPPQLSKVHTPNHPDSPFEVEVDHTALKLSKLEKLFKKSQGVKAMPDIEDGYTEEVVTLLDRFKMPQINRFDGSGDPMVHLRLFADILRPMGLTRPQKLSLFGRTLSGVAGHWYAKLQDEVKRNWDEMAEAFVAQYSYNTQIEITTRDLETTRQEPKETFSDFVIRWRAKASMMTLRPTDKDQIRMIVRNLHPKLMQRMIVVPFLLSQIYMRWGEQPRRTFNRNNNAGPSGAANTRASEVSMVTTTPPPPPRPMAATPFSGASGSNTQTNRFQPRGQRTFTPLYMPLTKVLGILIRKNHLKPLEPKPLPNPLPPSYDPAKYCAYHQQHGHDTDRCYRLRHEIQDLIDKQVIAPPDKPNVTTNPLPPHNQPPPPNRINFIQTGVASYDPSIYITPTHLPKPESFAGGAYDPSKYILSTSRIGLGIELPETGELCMIRGDGSGLWADDLTAVEEDFANLQFFDDQELGNASINWYDYEGSAEATGWLEDQPDAVGEAQPEQSPAGAEVSVVAGMAESQVVSPESAGAKNSARDIGHYGYGNC
ncbi:hypothetical protein HYC85_029265 [Camellia sinensis]|uniref:Retrotransposon gag domain-containing protein n=1 Tax=Camellia sinensis TaxID=4442 RepID=A0A7J7G1F2_CAMSI|nr:hypothetical protein HYC85_029265 [Camellia sinensis]